MQLLSSNIDRLTISYPNQQEFRRLKQEIFTQDTYYFESEHPYPRIIDAGAHIGMATLYFKKLYPFSEVVAIEANPQMTTIFEQNMWQNDCRDVQLVQAALGAEAGISQLFIDASTDHWDSTASFHRGAWSADQSEQSHALEVQTVMLAEYLQKPVDFLKMDIEGAEVAVLTAAKEFLPQIKHCIIEFHPTESQALKQLLELLARAGFSTTPTKNNRVVNPDLVRGLTLIEATRK